jgi:hypothetical protein
MAGKMLSPNYDGLVFIIDTEFYFCDTFHPDSAGNRNLQVPVFVLKAKQRNTIRKMEKGKWI